MSDAMGAVGELRAQNYKIASVGFSFSPHRMAAIDREGLPGSLYQFVLCYENADWNHLGQFVIKLSIDLNNVGDLYFRCVDEVNKLWEGISSISQ